MDSIRRAVLFLILFLCLSNSSCDSQSSPSKPNYPRSIGDITFDPALDNPDFKLCSKRRAIQYFAFEEKAYTGEKIQIIRTFQNQYQPDKAAKESGLIRIRFLVNCKGETDRFRIIGMNNDYQEKSFDASITDQIFVITKNLSGWKVFEGNNRDFYQYLIFKIKDGAITEIMP